MRSFEATLATTENSSRVFVFHAEGVFQPLPRLRQGNMALSTPCPANGIVVGLSVQSRDLRRHKHHIFRHCFHETTYKHGIAEAVNGIEPKSLSAIASEILRFSLFEHPLGHCRRYSLSAVLAEKNNKAEQDDQLFDFVSTPHGGNVSSITDDLYTQYPGSNRTRKSLSRHDLLGSIAATLALDNTHTKFSPSLIELDSTSPKPLCHATMCFYLLILNTK